MHRILVGSEALAAEANPALSVEAERHLKVVRPKDCEEVELFDGRGNVRSFRYSAAAKTLVAAGEMRTSQRPPVSVTLFACVTKGQRWDWTLQKATELGAARIVPVLSERTIVRVATGEREEKRVRWMKIVEEAARQSSAVWLPELEAPTTFAAAADLARRTCCFAGALMSPPPPMLLDAATAAAQSSRIPDGGVSVFIGPEGDFTPQELASLLEFATPVSFGPLVLRAETAAMYGLAVLSAALVSLAPRQQC